MEGLDLIQEVSTIEEIKRGSVWWARLGEGEGSEQNGLRPVIILQNDIGNLHSPVTIVAALTDAGKRKLPTHAPILKAELPALNKDSTVLLEQIRTIDKNRLIGYIGTVSDPAMRRVNYALGVSIGLSPIKKPATGGEGNA